MRLHSLQFLEFFGIMWTNPNHESLCQMALDSLLALSLFITDLDWGTPPPFEQRSYLACHSSSKGRCAKR